MRNGFVSWERAYETPTTVPSRLAPLCSKKGGKENEAGLSELAILCIDTRTRTSTHTSTHTLCIYIYIHIYIYVLVCVCVCVCVCIYM
jgi:hypothetical protein